jgi:signal transduction histidine kinase
MKARSFRFRIVVWSVLVSGAVLIAFSWVTWLALQQSRGVSLDESLAAFGFRHATKASKNVDTTRFESSMVENFGEDKAETRFLAFLTREDEVIYRSQHWPEDVALEGFPGSEVLLDPQPNIPAPPNRKGGERGKGGRRDRLVMEPRYYTKEANGKRFRFGVFANREVKLVVGADLSEISAEMQSLRQAFLVALPGALFLVALGAWLIARRAIRPVETLRRDMKQVSAAALDSRLEVTGAAKEFVGIVEQYNAMLERLERSFRQANRFSADASHELKTPLAIMRGTLEQGLKRCDDNPEALEVFSQLLEQSDRLGAILENLLLLSRADAGKLEISAERIDLTTMLETWLEDAGLLAEARDITIRSKVEPGIVIKGDPILLQQVAHNIFSNAVRYNEKGGLIACRLSKSDNGIEWSVANTGTPIAEEDRERIFERFERSGLSGEGVGLGLSIVKEIIVAHEGTVTVRENAEGMVEFRVGFVA